MRLYFLLVSYRWFVRGSKRDGRGMGYHVVPVRRTQSRASETLRGNPIQLPVFPDHRRRRGHGHAVRRRSVAPRDVLRELYYDCCTLLLLYVLRSNEFRIKFPKTGGQVRFTEHDHLEIDRFCTYIQSKLVYNTYAYCYFENARFFFILDFVQKIRN